MSESAGTKWNFDTFEKYINQRFSDLSLQLRERYEAQQVGVTAALAAAEKAVNAALIAAEKAVDKAEGAQQLRNEAQNEFRKSLSDLSGLMWTIKEGTLAVDSLRRELSTAVNAIETKVNALESNYANIQGRIWAVGLIWAVVVLAVSIGVRFIGK
jgi:DNA repair exonuclease SbcCD ATPase subunit